MTGRARRTATIGVAENGNTAVLVTIASGGELLDRRQIALTGRDLPTHPHHHEGSWAVGRYRDSAWAREISLEEAVALVARVGEAAREGARAGLEALAATVRVPITCIALADIDAFLRTMGRAVGAPWQAKHKLAAAAAIAATASVSRG